MSRKQLLQIITLRLFLPAQLGFLRAKGDGAFKPYSRTNADVFYDDRDNGQVVIVPDSAISKQVGTANLVNAHRQGRDYTIPENQRDVVYDMIDEMLESGTALVVPHGQTKVQTSEYGKNDLTSRLFSGKRLGIKAQEYGDWQKNQGRNVNTFYMNEKLHSQAQKAPYLNRLCVYSPDGAFDVYGNGRLLDINIGAFGVRFEKTAEGRKQNH